jgi:hypothetical protein
VGLADLLLDAGVAREAADVNARVLGVQVEDGAHGSTAFVDARQSNVDHRVVGDFTLKMDSAKFGVGPGLIFFGLGSGWGFVLPIQSFFGLKNFNVL